MFGEPLFLDSYGHWIDAIEKGHLFTTAHLCHTWTGPQRQSGISMPHYLDGHDEEVGARLHDTYLYLVAGARAFNERFVETPEYAQEYGALENEGNFRCAQRLYEKMTARESGLDSIMGFGAMIMTAKLVARASILVGSVGPAAAYDFIRQNKLEGVREQPLFAALDSKLYYKARNSRDFDQAVDFTDHASTDLARYAMRGGLDRKVLRHALKDKDNEYKKGAQLIERYASSPATREAMLGYLAVHSGPSQRRSRYGARYIPWVEQEQLRRQRHVWYQEAEDVARQERQAQREREHAERQARQDREREERQARWEREDQEWKRVNEELRDLYDKVHAVLGTKKSPSDRISQAISRLAPPLQVTLRAIPRSSIERVMVEVDALRAEQPDITARKVYLHFHAQSQIQHSAEHAKENTQIVGLLLGGDWSKSAPFTF